MAEGCSPSDSLARALQALQYLPEHGSTGPYPGGEVEFEEVRFGALSRAMSSAMSAAIWLTVPFSVVMSLSSATMRAPPSVKVDGVWDSGVGTSGGISPKCAGGAPARVGSGSARVMGG
ncbi:hypothetical protein CDL15_Pgr006370 [Punica granatum]|uniref:Uncharacterized protein n=1 Tax=Punica granatum TaxID=22663 RepID=A0A218VV87_PUNGR|nr:hypothetical protein CDL15_Pgr006370 [Punica granatum]